MLYIQLEQKEKKKKIVILTILRGFMQITAYQTVLGQVWEDAYNDFSAMWVNGCGGLAVLVGWSVYLFGSGRNSSTNIECIGMKLLALIRLQCSFV